MIENEPFRRIIKILDENGDGEIDLEEFFENIPDVLPILLEPGEEMTNLLRKVFKDFDVSGSNNLGKRECKLLFNLSCDKIGVERCNDWDLEYIFTKINENGTDGIIIDDFINNYWLI